MNRKTCVKVVSKKLHIPKISRARVPNSSRRIIYKENKEYLKIQIQGIQTKRILSLTRLANKIFLHTSTKCVRSSETFHTSYAVFSVVVLRETTSTEHTVSGLFLVFRHIASERNS
jgi:hypothetical protein